MSRDSDVTVKATVSQTDGSLFSNARGAAIVNQGACSRTDSSGFGALIRTYSTIAKGYIS